MTTINSLDPGAFTPPTTQISGSLLPPAASSSQTVVPAGTSTPSAAPQAPSSTPAAAAAVPVPTTSFPDSRIRLSALHPEDVYDKPGIMSPLQLTGGMLFPYTPTVGFSQSVNYMDLQLVHSNTDYAAYTRTPSVSLSVTGKFTVQSQTEGLYALACLHFLRAVSKSYFGTTDQGLGKAGLPPPVLVFSGYGNYMFNQLRVVLKSHSWTFDDTADGITVIAPNGTARLPALFSISCELMVVQTPQRMRNTFSFDKFASGELMQPGSAGWI